MTNKDKNDAEKIAGKKISLEEAIKQKLASKKQQQSLGKSKKSHSTPVKNMQSQQTKKINNQRKRTGV